MFRNLKTARTIFIAIAILAVFASFAIAQQKTEKYIPDVASAEEGMTLWQIMVAGGEVMIVLALLSIVALGLVIYYFMSIDPDKLLPGDFFDSTSKLVEKKKFEAAKQACLENPNLIAGVLMAGLSKDGREKVVVKEAIEDEGRRGMDDLWQKLSYLADIAAIAPMVGLLGTVLGMIQAFNVIAFQTGAVKPVLLASGISKAMVTTATGLIVAIPAMIFYSFFRGRLQNVTARLENISTELFHLLTDAGQTK